MRGVRRVLGAASLVLVAGACGGSEQAANAEPVVEAAAAEAAPAPVEAREAPAGQVIEVRMTMANGGRFEPESITAGPGDVIRFTNVENVHNISFPKGSNAGLAELPASSPYLTTPGQTWDLVVGMAPGTYSFQCDPHAAMGMVGTLTVQ